MIVDRDDHRLRSNAICVAHTQNPVSVVGDTDATWFAVRSSPPARRYPSNDSLDEPMARPVSRRAALILSSLKCATSAVELQSVPGGEGKRAEEERDARDEGELPDRDAVRADRPQSGCDDGEPCSDADERHDLRDDKQADRGCDAGQQSAAEGGGPGDGGGGEADEDRQRNLSGEGLPPEGSGAPFPSSKPSNSSVTHRPIDTAIVHAR